MLGIPLGLLLLLYGALLIHPLPLPFLNTQVRNLVVANMPPGTQLELGDMALALEGFTWPVIQFSPVVYKDTETGAKVRMDALEVGFSPIRALIGQPGASVTIVGPHIQMNQDLFGPRLAEFELVPDPKGGPATVRVLEGATAFPDAGFHADGIDVRGTTTEATHVRSDNDWLIYNLEAAEKSIISVIEQSEMGRFSRLIIKKGTLDMNDALYGVFRTFTGITLDVAPNPDGKSVNGTFAAEFAGSVMKGIFERVVDDKGEPRLRVSINNIDLGSFAANVDDPDAMSGISGTSAVSVDVGFDPASGRVKEGDFRLDLTGTDLRIDKTHYPIAGNIVAVHWQPKTGTFTLDPADISIGDVSAQISGVFVLGLDDLYGPTVAISAAIKNLKVRDLAGGAPTEAFQSISFKGWSAPLYGALGIDQAVLSKPGTRIESKGRIDTLRKGIGFDLSVAGEGISADDIKLLWPDFAAPDVRNWVVKNVLGGTIEHATMKLAFPVGTVPGAGERKPIPQNGIFIEMTADGVTVRPTDTLDPIAVQGKTRLQIHDSELTLAADGATLSTDKGDLTVTNAAVVMSVEDPNQPILEISGDMSGGIPAVTAMAAKIQPDLLKSANLPFDPAILGGDLNVRLVTTTTLDANGAVKKTDYSVTGNVSNFQSSQPVQGHALSTGEFTFMATPAGFRVGGSASVDGMPISATADGDLSDPQKPDVAVNATINLSDLSKMGIDMSKVATGRVSIQGKSAPDGSIQLVADLKSAAINIADLGITKDSGVAGQVKATVRQNGDITDLSNIELGFGDVRLKGAAEVDAKKGLQSAEFSNFALSKGDAAQVSLTPIKDGYSVRVRGDQLDLRPLLKRFFSLDQGSAGPQATSVDQTIAVDLQLQRALGFYKTTAYNVNLNLALKGTDMKKVSLQAQLPNNASLSVVTNPTDSGRSLSIAFTDLGTILRLVGVYPQLEGGSGAMVVQQDLANKVDEGQLTIKNFSIVDEKNLAAILEGHPQSRALVSKRNDLAFRSARVDFTHRVDRIQINDALVTGDNIGGSGNGFIYTDSKQYDLVGTFIPMFGINNAFAKLFGPLGGGQGGGLFGITFQVKGPLDKPVFRINPMSALAFGAFRSLFEFRAKEQPRVDGTN